MKQIKKWIGAVAFLLVFAVLFYIINPLFIPQDDLRREKGAFFQQPAQTLDVVYIGSSSMLRAVTPMEIWRDYGITGYSLATTVQAPVVTLAYLKDVFQSQKPEVVVLGCEWLFEDYNYAEQESQVRYALDRMPNSWAKIEAVKTIVEHDPSQSFLSFLFPILRYHSRWTEIETFSPSEEKQSIQMGYVGLGQSRAYTVPETHLASSGEVPPYSEDSLQYYRQAIELCKQNGTQVLLVKFPRMSWSEEEAQAQQDFADEMDVPLLDFNQPEYWDAISLDEKGDFYDTGHLSSTGASKISHFLGQYLQEKYQITDKRSDPAFSSWNDKLAEYRQKFSFCLHADNDGLDAFYETEIAADYLESNQLQLDNFTYTWTLYRDGKLIAQEQDSSSNQFTPELDGSGSYIAKCAVYQDGKFIRTLTSLKSVVK